MSATHHGSNPGATVTVRGSALGMVQEIVAGKHRLKSDEPLAAGGTDTGLSPYELLLAALGTCTSMTVGMYARRKGWPLEEVTVKLQHFKSYVADCTECEKGTSLLNRIERDLHFSGALTHEQRTRLLEIANQCPVHRTLTSKIEIETREF
jgi:putative redox protein